MEKKHDLAGKERIKKGLCYYCSSPVFSRTLCFDHLQKSKIKLKKMIAKRKLIGNCIRCGFPLDRDADAGRVKCITCRENIIY
jgi:hypothetical protein